MLKLAFRILSRGKLSILLFHKVPKEASPLAPHEIDLAGFTQIVEAATSLFQVIPLTDAINALSIDKLPPRAACITFDDGYADWVSGVLPVLIRLRLHATFFITSGQFFGIPVWTERILHAVSSVAIGSGSIDLGDGLVIETTSTESRRLSVARLEASLKYMQLSRREELLVDLESVCGVRKVAVPVMPVEDLRRLHSLGFGIGSHTVSHPILTRCDPGDAFREIAQAREQLEGLIHGRIDGFAYPNGIPEKDFDSSHIAMVRRAGYRYAVTTLWGAASARGALLQVPRFTPWGPSFVKMVGQFARNLWGTSEVLQEIDAGAEASRYEGR